MGLLSKVPDQEMIIPRMGYNGMCTVFKLARMSLKLGLEYWPLSKKKGCGFYNSKVKKMVEFIRGRSQTTFTRGGG